MKKAARRNPSVFPSVLSISMVLVMLGLFLLIALSLQKVSDYLRENVAMTVYMQMNVAEQKVLDLKKELEAREDVKQVVYVSQEEGAREFSEHLGQDFVASLGYNPIPATLDITLVSDGGAQTKMALLKQELSGKEFVRESLYPSNILEKIETNSKRLMMGTLVLGVVFAVIAITLINSTIRLDLYAQRFIIRSMQLVGARRWFIIRPFIFRSLRYGIYGFFIAAAILAGLLYYMSVQIPGFDGLELKMELGLIGAVILLVSVVLSIVCSYIATNKYLKLKLEELY